VEHHDDTRRYLGIFLGQLGANVVLARNVFEGVEAVKTSRPNLVLCDIKMPGPDGFDVLSEIRSASLRCLSIHSNKATAPAPAVWGWG